MSEQRLIQGFLQFPLGTPNYPGDNDRMFIVGVTGSGKTHHAMHHLSRANFHEMPWVIYDFKLDKFLGSIPGLTLWDVNKPPPDHPGIYVVRPVPEDDDAAVDAQLTAIWAHEDIGVYVDEGAMIPKTSKGLTKCLTQGRSKHIPFIFLSQRPVWLNRYVTSESEFKQVFRLQDADDIAIVQRWIPYPIEVRLPKFWSYYYDATDDMLWRMKPAPDQVAILAVFKKRLAGIPKVIG